MSISEDDFKKLAEQAAIDENVVPDEEMDYEEWLDWTGKDDSFVGTPEMGIPGTGDIYEGAMRVFERKKNEATTSMSNVQ